MSIIKAPSFMPQEFFNSLANKCFQYVMLEKDMSSSKYLWNKNALA